MNFLALIEAKRDGHPLTPDQIKQLVSAYTDGAIPDYQMAAFLMAAFFRGFSGEETAALTLAMRDSGEHLSLPEDRRPIVDKHSTGGVGDKISLPLAPLLACLGFRVPMISGRGLGITGGTLDKLDSIPGFRTLLPIQRTVEIVQQVGCVICGQTERMVPADKKLYALRDVTATVPSIPLIVASILSKKLAEQLDALVLDVKFGAAAFMKSHEEARQLATAMAHLGNSCGVKTRALITGMDEPLGSAAGNWLEVREAVACLEGKGPKDVTDLVCACAAHLLVMTGKSGSLDSGLAEARRCLTSREPRAKWDEMLRAQGADLNAFSEKLTTDTSAPFIAEVLTPRDGYLAHRDARVIGEVIRDLGGGRLTKESTIHYEVGVDQMRPTGQKLRKGELLARLHAKEETQGKKAAEILQRAFVISDAPPAAKPLISEIVE